MFPCRQKPCKTPPRQSILPCHQVYFAALSWLFSQPYLDYFALQNTQKRQPDGLWTSSETVFSALWNMISECSRMCKKVSATVPLWYKTNSMWTVIQHHSSSQTLLRTFPASGSHSSSSQSSKLYSLRKLMTDPSGASLEPKGNCIMLPHGIGMTIMTGVWYFFLSIDNHFEVLRFWCFETVRQSGGQAARLHSLNNLMPDSPETQNI